LPQLHAEPLSIAVEHDKQRPQVPFEE